MKRFKFKFHLIVFSRAIILNMLRMGLGRGVGSVVIDSCISVVKTLKFKKHLIVFSSAFVLNLLRLGLGRDVGSIVKALNFKYSLIIILRAIVFIYRFKSYYASYAKDGSWKTGWSKQYSYNILTHPN